MNERITEIVPLAPKNYEAWLYEIRIWKTPKTCKKYGGYHKGIFSPDEDNYFHSSEDIYMRRDFAFCDKIEYEILDYGTASDMGAKETKMLQEVDNGKNQKRGAAVSDLWYNKTNGGGKYGKGYKGMMEIEEMWRHTRWIADDNIKGDEIKQYLDATANIEIKLTESKSVTLTTGYKNKEKLKEILHQDNPYQGRLKAYVASAVARYREIIDSGKVTPIEWKPLVLLMPKEGSNDLPLILGGNLSAAAVVSSKHGDGLYYVGIPYELWQKALKAGGTSILRRVGNRYNPRQEFEREWIEEEDSVTWVVDHCKDNNLYITSKEGKKVLDKNHESINDELKLCGWKTRGKRNTIKRKAQTVYQNECRNADDHTVNFSKDGLAANPALAAGWKEKSDKYLKENGGDYDLVYKMSADHAGQLFKLMIAISLPDKDTGKPIFRKDVRLYIFFYNDDQKEIYIQSANASGRLVGRKELDWMIEHHFSKNKIHVEYLPITRKESEIEGWVKK